MYAPVGNFPIFHEPTKVRHSVCGLYDDVKRVTGGEQGHLEGRGHWIV